MSSPDLLDQAVEAMRLEHEDGSGGDADGTRWRIRASLERAQVARGRLLGALVMAGVLGTGGVSWAYLSGRLEGVWPWLVDVVGAERVSEPAQPKERERRLPVKPGRDVGEGGDGGSLAAELGGVARPEVAAKVAARVEPVLAAAPPAPARTVKPRVATRPSEAVAARPTKTPAIAAVAPPPARIAEAAPDLYRAAHQLHFHAGEPAAALAAWDTYLASQPSGRFAIEARYNRAMALIRLRRYRDAQLALQPFARGEIMPAGYRQSEAQRLSERLARALASAKQ